jgi:hypothetical protein
MESIVHIGQHKTGTTSIQEFAKEYYAELLRQKIYIPTRFMGRETTNHYELNLVTLADERGSPMKDKYKGSMVELKDKICREIESRYEDAKRLGCERVVWSNEGLSLLRYTNEYESLYNLFSPYSKRVSIVLCLRNKDEFKRAWTNQLIKMGLSEEKTDINSYRYTNEDSWLFDWSSRLERMAFIFDKVITYRYCSNCSIQQFCEAVNISLANCGNSVDEDFRLNVSS